MKARKRTTAVFMALIAFCTGILFSSCKKNQTETTVKGEEICVVENGKTEYKVVYPQNAAECVVFAAQEISSFVEQMTDAKLQVVSDASVKVSPRGKYISVGETTLWKATGESLELQEYNYDGFRIKTDTNVIYLCGARDRGTLYAAYDFLEKFGGVKFVAADETYVPYSENLIVETCDIKEIPAFQMRSYYAGDVFEDPLFAARSRMVAYAGSEFSQYGYGLKYDFMDNIHNSLTLMGSQYFDEHKELYARDENGKPLLAVTGGPADICWSNGIKDNGELDDTMEISSVKLVLEGVKNLVRGNETARYFMVGQMDSITNYCRCETCSAIKEKYGGNFSANIIRFMNVIAREIQKWSDEELGGREINMVTFAYTFSERPPVVMGSDGKYDTVDDQVICEDNLAVRIATANANLYYGINDSRQSAYSGIFGGWSAICKNIMIWDYATNFADYLFYIPNLRTLKENLLFYRDIGAVYVINQADFTENESWQGKLKTYISSKLLWNPELNVRQLTDEFLSIYFGNYAPSVSEVIGMYEDRVTFLLNSLDYFPEMVMGGIGSYMHFKSTTWPLRMLERAAEILENAIDSVYNDEKLNVEEKETLAKRLTSVLLTPQRMILYNYMNYYGSEGAKEYADKFLANCKFVDLQMINENQKVEDNVNKQFGG